MYYLCKNKGHPRECSAAHATHPKEQYGTVYETIFCVSLKSPREICGDNIWVGENVGIICRKILAGILRYCTAKSPDKKQGRMCLYNSTRA